MQISREVRKKLEANLPSYVLEYLTEKFEEAERYCKENEQLKQQIQWMLGQGRQISNSQMGYSQHTMGGGNQGGQQGQMNRPMPQQPNSPSNHYIPWERIEEDYYGPDYSFYMRRGVPGTGRPRSQGGGGSGGGAGGGAGSGGSGGGTGGASNYVPDITMPKKKDGDEYLIPVRDIPEVY